MKGKTIDCEEYFEYSALRPLACSFIHLFSWSGKKQTKIEEEDDTSDLSSDSHDHGVVSCLFFKILFSIVH